MQQIIFWVFALAALIAVSKDTGKACREIILKHSATLEKLNNIERLLLDIRDGTRNFYEEKRKFSRLNKRMVAKISANGEDKFFDIINISYEGASLRTKYNFKIGDIKEMSIFLYLYPEPINVKLKVLNICFDKTSEESEPSFKVGVKFMDMSSSDRKMLIETVDSISGGQNI